MRCKALANKEMGQEVYNMRRKVIDIIYLLKRKAALPRINVRITDSHEKYLAMGTMGGEPCVWITEEAVNLTSAQLLHIVAHEIGHAVFKLSHDETCPIMASVLHKPASMEEITLWLTKISA